MAARDASWMPATSPLKVCSGAGRPQRFRYRNSCPPLTGPQALGNKEYYYRGGKIRKVHGKRHHQATRVKWLNYSDPLPTIQERGDLRPFALEAREKGAET
jgi:hypothetical protein